MEYAAGWSHTCTPPLPQPLPAALTGVCYLYLLEWSLPHHWHRHRPCARLSLRGQSLHLSPYIFLTEAQAFGRPVQNMKKFEEGVFSDLRNLKPGYDASLEEPKVCPSWSLDFLFSAIHSRPSLISSSSTSASALRRNKRFFTGTPSHTTAFSLMPSIAISSARKLATLLPPTSLANPPSPSLTIQSVLSMTSMPKRTTPPSQSLTRMPTSAKAILIPSSAQPESTIFALIRRTAK